MDFCRKYPLCTCLRNLRRYSRISAVDMPHSMEHGFMPNFNFFHNKYHNNPVMGHDLDYYIVQGNMMSR